MENGAEVTIISKYTVQPTQYQNSSKLIHLTPFDHKTLSVQYIQHGLLFHKPQNKSAPSIVSNLLSSFSLALERYYPLAGRLLSTRPDNKTISVSIICNNKGVEFVHANAFHVKVSDIITPDDNYIPPIVRSFFPLNGLYNHEGHEEPLLGAQVTELLDGIFIGCSLNHSVGDGNMFWQFFNTWSRICRNNCNTEKSEAPLEFDRWFPGLVPHPILFPIMKYPRINNMSNSSCNIECFFRFSSDTVKRLKAKANEEMGTSNISSLQALVAHVWKSMTRARITHAPAQGMEEESSCWFTSSFRAKVKPSLPDTYVGNSVILGLAKLSISDIQSKCVGFTALILNQAMNSTNEARVFEGFGSWNKDLTFVELDKRKDWNVCLSSSPRFDVYGNDFGWGKPTAVRSGPSNKSEGRITLFPGVEGGIDMEIILPKNVMETLLQDKDFMEYVV